jgi:hypothetical protein
MSQNLQVIQELDPAVNGPKPPGSKRPIKIEEIISLLARRAKYILIRHKGTQIVIIIWFM